MLSNLKNIVCLGLILLFGLLSFTTPVTAESEVVKWCRVSIPTEGSSGSWMLANGSDVRHLTMAVDGTLYAYANPSGTSYRLFKSTDGGYSWSLTGRVTDSIVDIATAPGDARVVYYATTSNIYRSTDAGSTFVLMTPNPGGAGANNIEITSIDVTYLGYHIIVVGTRDTNNFQYGGIYIVDERVPFTWTDTAAGGYDVYAVAFSPYYPGDRQLVAVVTDEADTWVTTRYGDAAWGATVGPARLNRDNSGIPTPVAVTASAGIVFPGSYSDTGSSALFVAIDSGSGNGDVYRIDRSVAIDLNIGSAYGLSNVDVTSLDTTGDTTSVTLMAGAAASPQVYLSHDNGLNWARSTKEPAGQSRTYVLIAPDFSNSGRAYAATSGAESAFSRTSDGGITWDQIGLIDTTIGSGNILDLAISPGYSRDNTLFMLTFNGEHSLWRSMDGGDRWERVFTSGPADVDSLSMVELSPRYGSARQVVFLAGMSNGKPAIWKSTDNGQTFWPRSAGDPNTGSTFNIDVWAVVNNDSLFIGSYDGSNGLVYHTTNSGFFYSTGAVLGNQPLNSIALSPDYEQDETILAGSQGGWVYLSTDNGTSFVPLGQQLPELITAGSDSNAIIVAFDPGYSRNNTVYAASHCHKILGAQDSSAIYRFIIGTSSRWESIDSNLAAGAIVDRLAASDGGILYAANSMADGGMERSLDPKYPLGPTFETVTRGLDDGAALSGLWQCDNRLWSIDTQNTRLMTYIDSLNLPITLMSPSHQAAGIGTITDYTINNVGLDWKTLTGATDYRWQVDSDTDLSTVPTGFQGDTQASSVRLPALEQGTTYYWRVRATEPVLSPWSDKWSFTTSLGTETIAPRLYSPEAGAGGVLLKPVFQWSAIAGTDSYELLVSDSASFAEPLIVKVGDFALPGTAWQCNISLDNDTTYYWKVRAIGSGTQSAWSAVGAFITGPAPKSEPVPPPIESAPPTLSSPNPLRYSPSLPGPSPSISPPSPPSSIPPTSPSPVVQQFIPSWAIYLVGALLLSMILLLIIVLVLVLGIRQF